MRQDGHNTFQQISAVYGRVAYTELITWHRMLIAQCETPCLVQGRVSEWLSSRLGWAAGSMLPSVRCGLEGALLSALAAARRQPLHALLTACPGEVPAAAGNLLGTILTFLQCSMGGSKVACGQLF